MEKPPHRDGPVLYSLVVGPLAVTMIVLHSIGVRVPALPFAFRATAVILIAILAVRNYLLSMRLREISKRLQHLNELAAHPHKLSNSLVQASDGGRKVAV